MKASLLTIYLIIAFTTLVQSQSYTGSYADVVDLKGGGITSGGDDDIFSIGLTLDEDSIYAISYEEPPSSPDLLPKDFDQMKYYFNPYMQSLSVWIQADKDNWGEFSIRSMEGNKVFNLALRSNGKHELDLSEYPMGYYILEYQNNGNLEFDKIIIR